MIHQSQHLILIHRQSKMNNIILTLILIEFNADGVDVIGNWMN